MNGRQYWRLEVDTIVSGYTESVPEISWYARNFLGIYDERVNKCNIVKLKYVPTYTTHLTIL